MSIFGVISTLIWIVLLVTYIVISWQDTKSNRECRRAVDEMNALLLEQNKELIKANENLGIVIVRVCSKSVRDRKEASGDDKKHNSEVEEPGDQSETETGKRPTESGGTGTPNDTDATDSCS
jgi:hypothetical protein